MVFEVMRGIGRLGLLCCVGTNGYMSDEIMVHEWVERVFVSIASVQVCICSQRSYVCIDGLRGQSAWERD